MLPHSALRRSVLACSVSVAALVAGCAGGSAETASADSQSITDVPQTQVKDQSIGNCWTYATTGWVESLAKIATKKDLNLSESYVSYWYWYQQVVDPSFSGSSIVQGGSWGQAVELIRKWGIMDEGAFIPEEASAILSNRQAAAVKAMNESLTSGALKTPEARANKTLVRTELNKAWALSDAVVASLDKTFGPGGDKTLDVGSVPDGVPIYSAKTLPAKLQNPTTKMLEDHTLADAIGTPRYEWNPDYRSGSYAWAVAQYPTSATERRNFQKRVQRARHDKKPVVVSWYVDFNALNAQGQFAKPPAKPGSQGGHMTIIMDYQVDNVPGFGTLPAGVVETRPEALAAALNDAATIQFFRIKNSWGNYHSVQSTVGYHDLFMEYLNGPISECATDADEKPILDQCHPGVPLQDVVLPAGY
jgi:hypothetical protein